MDGGVVLDKLEVEGDVFSERPEGVLFERPEVEGGVLLETPEVEGGVLFERPEVEGGEFLERPAVEEEVIFSEGSDVVVKKRFEVEETLLVGFCIVKGSTSAES